VNQLAFWYDDHFHITDLFFFDFWKPRFQARYIRRLLHDDHLVSCLSRKRVWRFKNVDTFLAIVMSIPELPQTAHGVWFACFPESLDLSVDCLATFTSLTDLRIDVPTTVWSKLDLGAIVDSCPHLETLDLRYLGEYCGSLAKASNLRKVQVEFREETGMVMASSFLPLNSAQRFQSLSISLEWAFEPVNCSFEDFDILVNLTHIKFQLLSNQFCNILIHGKFKLTSLQVATRYPAWPTNLVHIFSAPSLEFLRHLDFDAEYAMYPQDPDLDSASQIWEGITNLRRLETVILKMGCRTSWFTQFAQLSRLISIFLYDTFIQFDDYDGTSLESVSILIVAISKDRWEERLGPSEYGYNEMLREHTVEVQKRFDNVFAGFAVPPSVELG